MAWWGIAYSAGPNQNNPDIEAPKDEWSYSAAQRAFQLRENEEGANRALINDCKIHFMDEIFSAVDPITIEMIKDVIVKLQVTRNITILISDHAFENVLQIADNIKILSNGHIISEGSPSTIVKDVSARKVYFGDTY